MDNSNLDAIEKAARAAAGLPVLPEPEPEPEPENEDQPDNVIEAIRRGAGLPPKSKPELPKKK